jgi:hypothetical protein
MSQRGDDMEELADKVTELRVAAEGGKVKAREFLAISGAEG